jgi:hypothetical protein
MHKSELMIAEPGIARSVYIYTYLIIIPFPLLSSMEPEFSIPPQSITTASASSWSSIVTLSPPQKASVPQCPPHSGQIPLRRLPSRDNFRCHTHSRGHRYSRRSSSRRSNRHLSPHRPNNPRFPLPFPSLLFFFFFALYRFFSWRIRRFNRSVLFPVIFIVVISATTRARARIRSIPVPTAPARPTRLPCLGRRPWW